MAANYSLQSIVFFLLSIYHEQTLFYAVRFVVYSSPKKKKRVCCIQPLSLLSNILIPKSITNLQYPLLFLPSFFVCPPLECLQFHILPSSTPSLRKHKILNSVVFAHVTSYSPHALSKCMIFQEPEQSCVEWINIIKYMNFLK